MTIIRRSGERGHANHGWLETRHSFSFADYHDPKWMGYRSLRVINEDVVAPGAGFGMHPHRDMEILTFILKGALEHRDSMGNNRVIRPGEIQYMAAGTGVRHSEFNPSSTEPVHLLQIWIQPNRHGVSPRYADRSFASAPAGALTLLASRAGRDGSIAINQDADVWLGKLNVTQKAGHALASGRHAWIHVAEGSVIIDGNELAAGDAIAIDGSATISIRALKAAQVILFDLD
jgi:quercetin 2,3-dioxygenase